MKKMLLVISILSLLSFGCNRSSEQSSGGGTGMNKQEQTSSPDSSMGSSPESGPSNSDMSTEQGDGTGTQQ